MAKKNRRLLGLSVWKWVNILGVLGGLTVLIVNCVNYANGIKEEVKAIDRKTDEAIRRLDKTMLEVKAELKQTSDLLHADLSWRYLYQNDPTRKNLAPRYDPLTRTLEFVDTTHDLPVRNP